MNNLEGYVRQDSVLVSSVIRKGDKPGRIGNNHVIIGRKGEAWRHDRYILERKKLLAKILKRNPIEPTEKEKHRLIELNRLIAEDQALKERIAHESTSGSPAPPRLEAEKPAD